MQRWVSMQLADHLGICANCSFPFPNTFLQGIFKKIMPDLSESSPWDPSVMTFTVMEILPEYIDQPGFQRLKAYLRDDTNHLKLFQLSNKIADLFDQYTIFRPEMVLAWQKGHPKNVSAHEWQAFLWRKLVENHGPNHKAELKRNLIDMLASASIEAADLSERVSVFGISYLPPYHLEAFAALSAHIPVNFFLLNPCREYWMDIVSEKRQQRIQRISPESGDNAKDLHFEEGNRLLAGLGGHGKDFFHNLDRYEYELHEFFREPICDNMLSHLQADILALRNRGPAKQLYTNRAALKAPLLEALQVAESDRSIQIHNCHSLMREIEVLHNNLLAMFEEDPALAPRDIVVMIPNIEAYAPLIQAVFDAQIDQELRIPYSIADHNVTRHNRLIDGFLALLDLRDSRLGVTQVLRLLDFALIRQQFALSQTDLPVIEKWVQDTNIRWGRDRQDRSKFGFPPYADNTWQSGIERLLLGYAMPAKNRQLFRGILPYDHIEGTETKVLGKFIEFAQRLFRCKKLLEQPKRPSHWQKTLNYLLAQFFIQEDEAERDRQRLITVINELADIQMRSGFTGEIGFDVIFAYLSARLEKLNIGTGFMSKGVTFCAMLPMRSIPFKVICLLGMNANDFPRDFQPLSFDLTAKNPKPGDRSRRKDDKYLFLESIISARKVLYISYIGQSILDNSRIPPSVIVSELLDTIEKSFFLENENILPHVVFEHRLQPFSASYFQSNSKLFSFSGSDRRACIASNSSTPPQPFIDTPLPFSEIEISAWRSIDIDDLCLFYSNPAKFLLQKRLGIHLEKGAEIPEDRENFELNPLAKHLIEQNIFRACLTGIDLHDFRNIQLATGELPPGNWGNLLYNQMQAEVDSFVKNIEKYIQNKINDPIDVGFTVSDFHLKGRLTDCFENGCIFVRYAKCKAKDILQAWIYHLIYCDQILQQKDSFSLLICKDKTLEFSPVSAGRKYLNPLLQLFLKGLSKPLSFFPESSYQYASQLQKTPDSPENALLRAKAKWFGSQYDWGEANDPYYQLCYASQNPIDDSFSIIASKVFTPIFQHCKEKDS
jgi:exodeoxyribonuclease V gamma subunit